MQLREVQVSNFKALGPTGARLVMPTKDDARPGSGDFVSIVGENNASKSTILQAIAAALNGEKPTIDAFHQKNAGNPIQVTMRFDNADVTGLDPALQAAVANATLRWTWAEPDKAAEVSLKQANGTFEKITKKDIKKALEDRIPSPVLIPAVQDQADLIGSKNKDAPVRQLVDQLIAPKMAGHTSVTRFTEAAVAVKAFLEGTTDGPVAALEKRLTRAMMDVSDVGAKLRFNAPLLTAGLHENVEVALSHNGLVTLPEHQGHGTQRALIVALMQVLAEDVLAAQQAGPTKTCLLLFEEPEIYLHPQMCRKMRDALVKLSRSGKFQVLCTTHSPVFLDLADRHDGIVIMTKDANGMPKAVQRSDNLFVGEAAADKRARLRMLLNFDAAVNEVFFARNVCLIEGDTERAALQAIADRLVELTVLDAAKVTKRMRETTVVNCRGKWTIEAFQEVLNHFEIDYRVIHDKDEDDAESGASGRILEQLGGKTGEGRRLVHVDNFESAVFAPSLKGKRDKPWQATVAIRKMTPVGDKAERFFLFALGKTRTELGA